MGRFYKAATPTFTQGMVADLDTDLMLGTLKVHDDAFDEGVEEASGINSLFKDVENLKADNEIVNARKAEYSSRVDALQEQIAEDPANYKKYTSEIRQLTRDIQSDLDNGVFKRASENFAQEAEVSKVYDSSGARENTKEHAKRVQHLKYQNKGGLSMTDPNNYNKFRDDDKPLNLLDEFDELGFIDKLNANFTPDQEASASAGPRGGYIWNKNGTTKFVTEADVEDFMVNEMKNNKWREVTEQEVILELQAETGNLAIDENSPEVVSELGLRERAFIDKAKNKIGFKQQTKKASVSGDPVAAAAKLKLERMNYDAKTAKLLDERTTGIGSETEATNNVVAKMMTANIPGLNSEAAVYSYLSQFGGNIRALRADMKSKGLGGTFTDEMVKSFAKVKTRTNQLIPNKPDPSDVVATEIWEADNKAREDRIKKQDLTDKSTVIVKGASGKPFNLSANGGLESFGEVKTIANLLDLGGLGLGTNISGVGTQVQMVDEFTGEVSWVDATTVGNTSVMEGVQVYKSIDAFGKESDVSILKVKGTNGKIYDFEIANPTTDLEIANKTTGGLNSITPSNQVDYEY